jgi:hypothetical protein
MNQKLNNIKTKTRSNRVRRICHMSESSEFSNQNNNNYNAKNKQNLIPVDKFKSLLPKATRAKRKQIFKSYPILKKLFYCTSKYQLQNILFELPFQFKVLLQEYMSKCFIFHVHMRPINNISQLLLQRNVIFNAIMDPQILNGNKSFANNLVKNFCKGMVTFLVLFYNQLVANKRFPPKSPKKKLEENKISSKTSLECLKN